MLLIAIIRVAIFLALMAMILFGCAGRFEWPMAWAILGIQALSFVVIFVFGDPQMIRVRMGPEPHAKKWDKVMISLFAGLGGLLTLVIAGLDYGRFHWSAGLPLSIRLGCLFLFVGGTAIAVWAMIANPFFAKFVWIQKQRGHYVVTAGPYAYLRHPGYSGGILTNLALPIALGSLWAQIPALFAISILIARTHLEDKTLQNELDGYSDYISEVRFRLLPGIW